jgi:hypothetical protein
MKGVSFRQHSISSTMGSSWNVKCAIENGMPWEDLMWAKIAPQFHIHFGECERLHGVGHEDQTAEPKGWGNSSHLTEATRLQHSQNSPNAETLNDSGKKCQ